MLLRRKGKAVQLISPTRDVYSQSGTELPYLGAVEGGVGVYIFGFSKEAVGNSIHIDCLGYTVHVNIETNLISKSRPTCLVLILFCYVPKRSFRVMRVLPACIRKVATIHVAAASTRCIFRELHNVICNTGNLSAHC